MILINGELYDLQEDPNELNDIYGNEGAWAITQELEGKLQQLRNEYDFKDVD